MPRYMAIVLAVVALVAAMITFEGAHRFVTSLAVIPLILVAVVAEQINRRAAVQRGLGRLLSAVQVLGFVLGASMFLAAGVLRH